MKLKPVKEKVHLELDSKKAASFSKQALSLLSGYISENPGIIRSIGTEALSYMKESSSILQDNDIDPSEKSKQLMELAKTHLTSIAEAISKDDSPLSKEVGKALKNTGTLLGSRLVTQSLGQSQLFTGETKTKLIDMSVNTIKTKTQKTLLNVTHPIQGPKEKEGTTILKVSPKMANRMQGLDTSNSFIGTAMNTLLQVAGFDKPPSLTNPISDFSGQFL